MFRLILSLVAIVAIALPLASAQNPVPERNLIGEWMNDDGSLLLELRADRQAIFTVPTFRQGEKSEPQFGGYFLKDRVWTLKITDANHRDYVYNLVSLDANKVNLIGVNKAQMVFYRIGLRFSDLDRNRDGVLELDEVKDTRLGRYFNDIDANKDGQLTPAEFVAYWIRFPPPVVIQR
jgi:EF hand domain-containing protein